MIGVRSIVLTRYLSVLNSDSAGPDTTHEGLAKDVVGFGEQWKPKQKVKDLGKSSFIGVICGFWYEWSLSIPAAFGIHALKKEATLFDEGEVQMTVSTWPQVGRAVAALLSLPVKPEGGESERSLEHFKNGHIYVGSFTVSQKDMLDSCLRVTGTNIEDWSISKEPSFDRWKNGLEAMKQGDRMAFAGKCTLESSFPTTRAITRSGKACQMKFWVYRRRVLTRQRKLRSRGRRMRLRGVDRFAYE